MNVNSFLLQVRSTLCSLSQFTPWHRALCHVARTVYLYLFTLLDEEGHCEIEVSHPKNNIMTQFHFGCLTQNLCCSKCIFCLLEQTWKRLITNSRPRHLIFFLGDILFKYPTIIFIPFWIGGYENLNKITNRCIFRNRIWTSWCSHMVLILAFNYKLESNVTVSC